MSTDLHPPAESVVDRFLRYVRIDTQSREVSEHCMAYATVPSSLPNGARAPTVGFLAHVDWSRMRREALARARLGTR